MSLLRRSILLLVSALLLVSCSVQQVAEPTPTPIPVPDKPTFTVQRGEVVQEVDFSGRVGPLATQPVIGNAEGKIGSVFVAAGERVTEGQVIAVLDDFDELQEQLDTLRAEAKAKAEEVEAVMRRAEIKLQLAELRLKVAQDQGLSDDQVQIAELELELAQMDMDDVKANLEEVQAVGTIQELEDAIEKSKIVSPVDGVLITNINPGSPVRKNRPVAAVGDPRQLELIASVSPDVLELLKEGTSVTVVMDSQPDLEMTSTIRQLPYPFGSGSDEGDGNMRITLPTSDNRDYRIGDTANITLILAKKEDALWLPPEAVRSVAGLNFVIVQQPGGLQRLDVKIGITSQERIEIIDGLVEGQTVVAP